MMMPVISGTGTPHRLRSIFAMLFRNTWTKGSENG